MEEGRIAAHGDHLLLQAVIGQLSQALGNIDAGAHAVADLEAVLPRGLSGHEIAADIAHNHAGIFLLPQGLFQQEEGGAVRASGAEGHFSDRQVQICGRLLFRQRRARQDRDGLFNIIGVQLADFRQRAVGTSPEDDLQSVFPRQGFQRLLQEGVNFFKNQDFPSVPEVGQDKIFRQRPEGAQAQQTHPVLHAQTLHRLLTVQPAGAARNNQGLGLFRSLIVVVCTLTESLPQLFQLFQSRAVHIGHADHSVPLPDLLQGMGRVRQGTQDHVAPAMADPCRQAKDDNLPGFLREIEGVGHHILGFLHGSWFQQGDSGGHSLPAGIELVGGRMGAGVVAGYNHQTALDPMLGGAVQGVGGTEQAVLFHNAERPAVCQRRADTGLQRADLVCRPFRVEIPFSGDLAQHTENLGRRRPWVGRGEIDSGLHCPPHNGLIALHETHLTWRVGCHGPFHEMFTLFSLQHSAAVLHGLPKKSGGRSSLIVAHFTKKWNRAEKKRGGDFWARSLISAIVAF